MNNADNMKNSILSDVSITFVSYEQPKDYGSITLTTSENLIEELIRVPTGSFAPYAAYNKNFDSIEAHFKNDEYYAQPLNENMDLLLSHSTNEVVGVRIYNIKKIVPYQY